MYNGSCPVTNGCSCLPVISNDAMRSGVMTVPQARKNLYQRALRKDIMNIMSVFLLKLADFRASCAGLPTQERATVLILNNCVSES
jgi:hypothetical protein